MTGIVSFFFSTANRILYTKKKTFSEKKTSHAKFNFFCAKSSPGYDNIGFFFTYFFSKTLKYPISFVWRPGLPTIEDNAQPCTSMQDLHGKCLIIRSTYIASENPQNSFLTE